MPLPSDIFRHILDFAYTDAESCVNRVKSIETLCEILAAADLLLTDRLKQITEAQVCNRAIQALTEEGMIRQFACSCCCWLPDPFRGMGAWRKTTEPQKPGNSPGPGSEVVERHRVAKE